MVEALGEHTLAFVCGLHRSGTTSLGAALGTNPHISSLRDTGVPHDEGQHLQPVYPTARAHGGPGRFAFDPAAHLTEDSPIVTPDAAARLFAAWAPYWELDRPVLVEKSPPNLVRTRFLQALFPDARFVVVVRHPVITALATVKLATTWSMRRRRRRPSVAEIVRHWVRAHEYFRADRPRLRHVHLLRWEDLVADPASTLAAIGRFLEVPDGFTRPDLDPAGDRRYVEQWRRMVAGAEGAAVRDALAGRPELLAGFGYRADDPGALDAMGPV